LSGGLHFQHLLGLQQRVRPTQYYTSKWFRKGLKHEGVTACQAAPPLKTNRNPTATLNCFRVAFWVQPSLQHCKDVSCTGRALSPLNYTITSPALWPSCRNYPSSRVDLLLQSWNKEKVARSYSTTAVRLTTRRIIKSAWPPFATWRMMSWTPSMTTNNSRTSQPMSPQLKLPKMRMRSREGSGGRRTPSALNTGATCRIAPAYQGILTILLQQSRIMSIVRRLAPSQKQHS
jgi:hypothetical protein